MALIVFCSHKGSPGTSLTSLAVAGGWPVREGRTTILVEADPSGGVIALRYGLGREPGLLTLATSVRHGSATSAEILEHAQPLPGGLLAVVAPEHSSSVGSAFKVSGPALGMTLAGADDLDVIVDIGRLSSSSPSRALLGMANAVFMVARPTPEQIVPGAEQLKMIPNARWCLVGDKPYSLDQVTQTFGIPAFSIADDPRGAHALEHGGHARKIRRSALARSARQLAENVSYVVNPVISEEAGSSLPEPLMPSPGTSSATLVTPQ